VTPRRHSAAGLALALLLTASPAAAHPESPLVVRLLIGMEARQATYIGEIWSFDAPTSAWLLDSFDADGSGAFEPAELPALQAAVEQNVAPSVYLTRVFAAGAEAKPLKPYGFHASVASGTVSIAFALGLPAPVAPGDVSVELADPANFLAIQPVDGQPVVFRGATPGTCVPRLTLNAPDPRGEGGLVAVRLTLACAAP